MYCSIFATSMFLFSCGQKSNNNEDKKNEFELSKGGVSSNGGASLLDADNPWFLGDGSVTYCINSQNFSVNNVILESLVKNSIDDWVSTIKDLKGNEPKYNFPDGVKRGMSIQYTYQDSCSDTTQLRFEFGSDRKASWGPGYNKIGEALRTPIDLNNGNTTGVVWISPDMGQQRILQECDSYWSLLDKNPLSNILMHELGHVFGFRHSTMPFAHFMNEDAPGKILGWVTGECLSKDQSGRGEQVTSQIFVDRLSFFTGKPYLARVQDDHSWLKKQMGFDDCAEDDGSALLADSLTFANTGEDLSTVNHERQSEIFKTGSLKVNFNFTSCNKTQSMTAKFIPDEASRLNHKAIVTGDYIYEQSNNPSHPHAEYILAIGQYAASGILQLENGIHLPAFLEARSDDDRFLTLTFQSEGSPHIQILLRDRIVYGFANVAYRTE